MAVEKSPLKKELSGVQSLVTQLQAQAGEGQIDAALIDQIASAVNVAVDQAGKPHDEASTASAASNAMGGGDVQPAPPPPAAHTEPDGDEDMEKVYSSRPPKPEFYVPGSADEATFRKVGEFSKALEAGDLKKAQKMAEDQREFDLLLAKAQRMILDEQGVTYKNIRKINSNVTTLEEIRETGLKKGITASSGFSGVYLQRLVRLMLPIYAGMRRRIPNETPKQGAEEAMWKVQQGFQNLDEAALLVVGEAAIGEEINETPTVFSVPFRDITLNDKVSLKATATSRGYDDPLQVAIIRVMTALLRGEERKIIGDNKAAISKPSAPTAVGAGSGTVGSATAKFCVTALTYRGWLAKSKGTTSAVGETDASDLSTAVDLSAKESVTVTWAAVPGAVAYNLYYNASSTTKYYVGTYTKNKAVLTALPASGNTPPATNVSANANGYEGLISWCGLSTIYDKSIINKIALRDNAGAGLTAGTSGIDEFDDILAEMWTNWQIAPTAILTSAKGISTVTDKVLGLNSGSMYRIEMSQERGTLQGGAFLTGYVNKFAPFADGTPRFLDVIPHPYMPEGMFNFMCESVPYPMSREARGFAMETIIPYTYFPLASTDLSFPFAVTVSETLECYHPSAQTALVGVDM